jgi:hypothetical protein
VPAGLTRSELQVPGLENLADPSFLLVVQVVLTPTLTEADLTALTMQETLVGALAEALGLDTSELDVTGAENSGEEGTPVVVQVITVPTDETTNLTALAELVKSSLSGGSLSSTLVSRGLNVNATAEGICRHGSVDLHPLGGNVMPSTWTSEQCMPAWKSSCCSRAWTPASPCQASAGGTFAPMQPALMGLRPLVVSRVTQSMTSRNVEEGGGHNG